MTTWIILALIGCLIGFVSGWISGAILYRAYWGVLTRTASFTAAVMLWSAILGVGIFGWYGLLCALIALPAGVLTYLVCAYVEPVVSPQLRSDASNGSSEVDYIDMLQLPLVTAIVGACIGAGAGVAGEFFFEPLPALIVTASLAVFSVFLAYGSTLVPLILLVVLGSWALPWLWAFACTIFLRVLDLLGSLWRVTSDFFYQLTRLGSNIGDAINREEVQVEAGSDTPVRTAQGLSDCEFDYRPDEEVSDG